MEFFYKPSAGGSRLPPVRYEACSESGAGRRTKYPPASMACRAGGGPPCPRLEIKRYIRTATPARHGIAEGKAGGAGCAGGNNKPIC